MSSTSLLMDKGWQDYIWLQCLRQYPIPLNSLPNLLYPADFKLFRSSLFSVYVHLPPNVSSLPETSLFFGTEISDRIEASWGSFELAQVSHFPVALFNCESHSLQSLQTVFRWYFKRMVQSSSFRVHPKSTGNKGYQMYRNDLHPNPLTSLHQYCCKASPTCCQVSRGRLLICV